LHIPTFPFELLIKEDSEIVGNFICFCFGETLTSDLGSLATLTNQKYYHDCLYWK
jgi:hypothetical protein